MLDFLKNVKKGDKLEIDIEKLNQDYIKWFPVWTKNRDFYAGSEAVKGRSRAESFMAADEYKVFNNKNNISGTAYLPWPNGMEKEEYLSYRDRAIYANYVEETVNSFQGKLYSKPIQYRYNDKNEVDDTFLESITFDGKSADTLIREITEEIEVVNKIGVLVDYPTITDVNGNPITPTKKEIEDNDIKARVALYKAESITNWGEAVLNNQRIPIFFIVKETVNDYYGFENKADCVYRVLYLDIIDSKTFVYKQALIKPIDKKDRVTVKYKSEVLETITPIKNGKTINYIPFWVITDKGTEYRKYTNSIIGPLVDTNMGHYRNSADWEHELYQVGLKTIVFFGWDKKKYGNPRMGGAIAAPINGQVELVEATSDSGIEKEMQNKENRMAVFGSQRISQQGRYVQSAQTSDNNTKSETANLQSISISVSKVMGDILSVCAEWSGKPNFISVQINRDFKEDPITGDEANKWRDMFMTGGMSFDAYYNMMEKREAYPDGWSKEKELDALLNNPMMGASNPAIDGLRRELEELKSQIQNGGTSDNSNDNIEEDTEDDNNNDMG